MKKNLRFAIFFIAACAGSTGALAQKVYKCGATYSQIPCDGAVTINTQDVRTLNQKSQADALAAREAANASALEKARLKEEALAAGKSTPPKKAPSKAGKTEDSVDNTAKAAQNKAAGKHKKGDAEFFTAKTVAEKPKKAASAKP